MIDRLRSLLGWLWSHLPYRRTVISALLAVIAVGAVALTSPSLHTESSGEAVGVLGGPAKTFSYLAFLGLFVIVFERLVDPGRDWFEEIGSNKWAIAGFLTGLALSFAVIGAAVAQPEREGEGVWKKTRCIEPSAALPIVAFVSPESKRPEVAADTASQYVGVVEEPPGSNSGPEVDQFLASVGLGPGYAWCAAFRSYVLARSCMPGPKTPSGETIRSAGVVDFLGARKTIKASKVRRGLKDVPRGYGAVFKYPDDWRGHHVTVAGDEDGGSRWRGPCGTTIEGNTSSPS